MFENHSCAENYTKDCWSETCDEFNLYASVYNYIRSN